MAGGWNSCHTWRSHTKILYRYSTNYLCCIFKVADFFNQYCLWTVVQIVAISARERLRRVVTNASIRLKHWWYHHKLFYNADIIIRFSTIRFWSTVLFLHFRKSLLITASSCQPHSIHLFPSHFSPALSNSPVPVHASFFPYLVCENTAFSTFNQKMYGKPNPLKKVMDLVYILYPFSTILCSRDIWHYFVQYSRGMLPVVP